MANSKLQFEDALSRLEKIVGQMEKGDLSLEEALKYFEEGTKLVNFCNTSLNKAEMKVVKILEGSDGKPREVEFEDEE